jgi:CBS domain containing-hemolysin-like protein
MPYVIPVLDKIGRGAFMFYMFFVLVSFIIAVAYQVGGVEPPDVAKQYGKLPEVKPTATLVNQTYDVAVQYVQTTQTVTFLSLQAVMQALAYILNAVVNMGGFLASLAHALFNGTPLHGPIVAAAAAFGFAIQAAAWIWIITSVASLLRGG